MTLIYRSLSFALMTLVTGSAIVASPAEAATKENIELAHLLNRNIILGDGGISHGTFHRLGNAPVPDSRIEPGLQIAPGEVAVPEFLPVIATLDEPVSDSVKSTADSTGTLPNDLGVPQPGPEPYVMLLVGLGMIVEAITLHLRSMHQTRSGFKPSQGMPFV